MSNFDVRLDYRKCFGHTLADTEYLDNGDIRVTLYNSDETVNCVKISRTQRGVLRIMDNWSKKRGSCKCYTLDKS